MASTLQQALAEIAADDPDTRVRGVRRLSIIPGPGSRGALLALLSDPSDDIRGRAAYALGHQKDPAAIPLLARGAREDIDSENRMACLQALAHFPVEEWSHVAVEALDDAADEVVVAACSVLNVGHVKTAVPRIEALLEHSSWRVRFSAATALLSLYETKPGCLDAAARLKLIAPFERLAAGSHPEGQQVWRYEAALEHLERLKRPPVRRGESRADDLLAALRDGDDRRRYAAVRDLSGRDDGPARAALIDALKDPTVRVRTGAILRLAAAAPPEALAPILDLLANDPSFMVRRTAATYLRAFENATPGLITALDDADRGVVEFACDSLSELGDAAAIPCLLKVLDHPNWDVREAACRALLSFGVGDQRVVTAIEQLIREPEAADHDLDVEEDHAMFSDPEDPEETIPPTLATLPQEARELLAAARRSA